MLTDLHSGGARVIAGDNLSFVWAKVLLELSRRGVEEISPLVISITGFDVDGAPIENGAIRSALDEALAADGEHDSEIVAFTIFPQKYWLISGGDRQEFFELCRESFLTINDFSPQLNRRGLYFQRLVDYEGTGSGLNQLETILDQYARHPTARRSKWQLTTFDPTRDLIEDARLGFPCLQQLSFTFEGADGLVVNAFYATQQLLRKGYGNYLGLCRLGAFIASQMERKLVRLNVFVGVAHADANKRSGSFPKILAVAASEMQGMAVTEASQ